MGDERYWQQQAEARANSGREKKLDMGSGRMHHTAMTNHPREDEPGRQRQRCKCGWPLPIQTVVNGKYPPETDSWVIVTQCPDCEAWCEARPSNYMYRDGVRVRADE
jgi:hypothetical protein